MELIQYLDKTAHVGTFEPVGQIDIQIEIRDSPLQPLRFIQQHDRIGDILDANLLDIYTTVIQLALYVFHGRNG